MNLEQYFGLSKQPFPKAATSNAILKHPALEQVINRMHFALLRDTIGMFIAESGCGKSTALSLFVKAQRCRSSLAVSTLQFTTFWQSL
jgi:ABC-type nitrate/sulfonate/bicarbonate transport system ATPase subunit